MFHQDFYYLSVSFSMVATYVYDTTSRNLVLPISADDIVDFLRFADDYEGHPTIVSIVLSGHDSNADFEVIREALDTVDVQI